MKKIWLIAKTHYKGLVRSGNFLFLTFFIPVVIIVVMGITLAKELGVGDLAPVGYVDLSGELAAVEQVTLKDEILELHYYANQDEAQAAFDDGLIQGYLLIPSNYLAGGGPQYFGEKAPNETLEDGLREFLRRGLLPSGPEWALERLEKPSGATFVALSSGERVEDGPALFIRIVAPAALALFLGLTLLFTSGQMGTAVVREKDSRAMEMIISSVRPSDLVAGKVIGTAMLSLTQFAVWGLGAVIGLAIYLSGKVQLNMLSIPWEALLWMILLGVPGYLVYAVVAAGMGIIAGDSQQAQQLAGLLGMFAMAPFWLTGLLVNTPNSALAVGLSFFPLTGPSLILLRMSLTEVPLWQLIGSFATIAASLFLAMWLVSRIFRAAMLVYGQSLGVRQIWQALRKS